MNGPCSSSILIGEDVYKGNQEKWEMDYPGKIIAIDVQSREVVGVGHTIDDAHNDISAKYLGKRLYFRKVGPYRTTSVVPWFSQMLMPCRSYGLRIIKVGIAGPKAQKNYEAYADLRASKSLMAEEEAHKLHLTHVGDTTIIAGTQEDCMKLFRATVYFLKEEFTLLILGTALPEHAAIKVLIGKDILMPVEV